MYVAEMHHGTVAEMRHGSVAEMRHGSVAEMRHGSVAEIDHCKNGLLYGSGIGSLLIGSLLYCSIAKSWSS